jgi:predicted TIM-barrel fold metal-dependent hydrolase
MFASGWPHGGGTWKETLAGFTQSLGAMPLEVREQLLGGTARDFYRIGPA